ncbi:MAG: AAA family ATPase [Candidatus Sungbacteria bacterium]|nr:AAA family ATPase [Candidatus Sungbacteria bacterium]
MNDIRFYVLTGGPCGGKTSSLVFVVEKLRNFGFKVFTIPEVSTELFTNGVEVGCEGISNIDFQEQQFLKQMEQENRYLELAKRHKGDKKIIVCDRGIMDGRAYIDPDIFDAMIIRLGFIKPELRDQRYDGVFHLVTAADGAEEFYTLANNKERKEKTPEEALNVDRKTQQAWNGHPHWRAIDNSTDFEGKKHRLLQKLCRRIGIPAPLEIERKYLLRSIELGSLQAQLGIPYVKIDIEQTYLKTDTDGIRRIRARGQDGACIYYYEEKKMVRPGVRIETGRIINAAEYSFLLADESDEAGVTIKKDRYCFPWRNQYFELDIFHEPLRHKGLTLLEIELTDEHDKVELPPFLDVAADVTSDDRYSNYALARKE